MPRIVSSRSVSRPRSACFMSASRRSRRLISILLGRAGDAPHLASCRRIAGTKELAAGYETSSWALAVEPGGDQHLLHVSRALKQPGLWLTLTYLGLILLMARA